MATQLIFSRNAFSSSLVAIFFSSVCMGLSASPQVTSVTISEREGEPEKLIIQGIGFGSKEQAAPVLFDQLDASFENGTLNKAFQSLEHGDKIPSTTMGQDSIWAGVSSGAWDSFTPEVTTQAPPRHKGSKKHYLLLGHDSTIGNPVAYGGDSGWKTPTDNKQLYVSWWFKPKYTPSLYWRISSDESQVNFIPGETLDIGGIAEAQYIGKDKDGLLNIVFMKQPPHIEELKSKPIIGQSSRAQTSFPSQFIDSSGVGYESPGAQKYIRVWEDSNGKDGIRFSWTQMHASVVSTNNSIASATVWDFRHLDPNKWNHLELELDSEIGIIQLYVNSKPLNPISFDPRLDMPGLSPTVALLGLNGKVGKLQISEIDDIYIDKTRQRVLIGDADSYNNVNHWEVQKPTSWDNNNISVEVFKGSLENYKNGYIYVFDSNGLVNKQGIAICSDCQLPPSKISLDVN